MAAAAPPQIIVNDPSTTSVPSDEPTPRANGRHSQPSPKPTAPPAIDTTTTTSSKPILNRTNTFTSTPLSSASCYLCDEQNPGDFTPTTKHLLACQLCSRYFCPIHQSPQYEGVCNINHASYYHEMLQLAKKQLDSLPSASNGAKEEEEETTTTITSPGGTPQTTSRALAEILIQEGIFPSLGEREKAIFVTSPVDEQKRRELESWRKLEAAVANGGERGRREPVEEREAVGADIAI
jgi:hypothetical protein